MFDRITNLIKNYSHKSGIGAVVSFTHDEKYVFVGYKDSTLQLIDRNTGHVIRTYIGHTNQITSIASSMNSTYFVTGSTDGTAKLWETKTGRLLETFIHKHPVVAVAIDALGQFILTADGNAHKWSANGTCLHS